MFRFWGSDSRGSDKTVDASQQEQISPLDSATAQHSLQLLSLKRRQQTLDDEDESPTDAAPAKRAKFSSASSEDAPPVPCGRGSMDRARDEIRHQFGVEILLKHNELRLINQELGKCQAALEQLRRCHLIPYPVNCPTPEEMLDIASGKGTAVRSYQNEKVPRWAAPFGVVDGPYARHYAKWLIPDPSFDGQQPEWQFTPEAARARVSFVEGRTTRNSFADVGNSTKGRPVRGMTSQKLQALPASYPQPKDKAGPCVLKRSDGETVKLVCIDCNRENFSSTQGFINHCRIAHKRDFKSHEEAAVHCGQPIEAVAEGNSNAPSEEKSQSAPSSSASVHPFARTDISETYDILRSRLNESLKLYRLGKLPGVKKIPNVNAPSTFKPSSETPYLSRLMQSRKFAGSLHDMVADAKTVVSLEDITPGEDSDDSESSTPILDRARDGALARASGVMRVPAKSTKGASAGTQSHRPTSSKGRGPPAHAPLVSPPESTVESLPKNGLHSVMSDDDVDMEEANLSPSTLISNNAPSLVSDDGEYDDSDEGSSVSGASDSIDAESVSDVAEINLDDEHETRPLRRASTSAPGAMRLRKDDSKQVTLMSPVKRSAKARRGGRV